MRKIRILWTDDEIEVLRPHILFLSDKGYDVSTCSNGNDTIDLVSNNNYDIIFLDEHMPGLSGIETLREIKHVKPEVPVVMITKSEEEDIMEMAIGSQIADYLIKPVKPNQILLTLKKLIDSSRLVTEATTTDYRMEFGKIRNEIDSAGSYNDWTEIYKKLIYWDTRLDRTDDSGLIEIFAMQEQEANNAFAKFISKNYLSWFKPECDERPLLSPAIFPEKVLPLLKEKKRVLFIVIDNLRYDQWKILSEELGDLARVLSDEVYCSILPTATQYARNAIFSGLMPGDIESRMPQYWVSDEEEEGKNMYESELLADQLKRHSIDCSWSYSKISSHSEGKKVNDGLQNILNRDLTVLVYNFVDMLSHARTEIGLIRDLADNESAYRSLTRSWFTHSPLIELLKKLKGESIKIVLTTDHGTIRVSNPVKIIGDRKSSTNIRYKLGRNLDYPPKEVFEIVRPEDAHLPKSNISSKYIFARGYDYFLYPKNYNHFANYYRNTFQHGGISMHEMIIPLITLEPIP
jgi:CheY-like chemotaxis protein